jgi:PAS domain S-box-containing protein
MNEGKSPHNRDQLLLVPVYLAAILILALMIIPPAEVALEHVYEPPLLLLALNTLFITVISFWIAWQTLRGYLASGLIPFLVLGCALLAAGSAALIAGLLIYRPDGVNDALRVYNLGFLLSALLHFTNALLMDREVERVETAEGSRQLISGAAYLAVFLIIGGIWAAVYHDLISRFFDPEAGATTLREVILTAIILLLVITSHLLLALARQRKAEYLRWYGYGLALIALGLFGSALGLPGSPLSWAGRASRYLGNLYLLAAAVTAVREARHRGMRSWEEAVQAFFREPEGRYRTLVESARSSIVSVDRQGRVFLWNPSAERLFGYSADEVMGQALAGLITTDENRDDLEELIRKSPHGVHELTLRRRDGSEFSAEFTVYGLTGREEKSLNIRDITERKKAEEALLKAKDELEERVQERTMELQNLAGHLEKSRHELRRLVSELVMTEEKERKRIAGVLHDDVAQILAAVRMQLEALGGASSNQNEPTLIKAKGLITDSLLRTRALMNDLGNPVLFELGLKAAIEALANRLMANNSVRIHCDIQDEFKSINPDVKVMLYQIVQELLNNVVKHSSAQNAHIRIDKEDGNFQVKVTDDGMGFDPHTLGVPTIEGGFGLYSIQERLTAVDGSLRIVSTPGAGTVVLAAMPADLD